MSTNDDVVKGFNILKATRKAGAKWTEFVREKTTAEDYSVVCGVADKAVDSLPTDKGDDGKDKNAQERNDYVRTIRRALSIVGKERGQHLKIKRVEGVHVVSIGKADEAAEEQAEQAEDAGADAAEDAAEQEQEALWLAVELVTKNLDNKAVRGALAEALKKYAAKV